MCERVSGRRWHQTTTSGTVPSCWSSRAEAAGLQLTPGQPQQTDCLPWDARNFTTSSSKTRFCISLQNQIAFLSFTTIFSCLIPPSHFFFLNTEGQKKPCHSDRCRMLALWKSMGRDHCCSEDLAVWLGCYIGLYVMKPNFCFCKQLGKVILFINWWSSILKSNYCVLFPQQLSGWCSAPVPLWSLERFSVPA